MNPATIRVGDLTVNRLGFGAMRVCDRQIWGPPADPENARLVLRRAYALGHNKRLSCIKLRHRRAHLGHAEQVDAVMSSNYAMYGDTYSAPIRAPSSARNRER